MWSTRTKSLSNGRVLKFSIDREGTAVSCASVLARWQNDADFRTFFLGLLADAPFAAFRWETPPITTSSVDRPFEFVLLDSPGLERKPEPKAFAEHFASAAANEDVLAFANLGNDAVMVVPCPMGAASSYGHLAAFVRKAPEAQRHSLWSMVGKAVEERLGSSPLWLSTAGAGVSWLHVRLDSKPKYYGYVPYRDSATAERCP